MRDVSQEPIPTPSPTFFRPTQAVYGGRFSADRAETRLETSTRADSGLDPIHHRGRETGRGPETGNLRRREGRPAVVVGPVWETRAVIHMNSHPDTRNPAGEAGFLESFAVTSCKVYGSGRNIAECKKNLPYPPD